MEAVPIETLFAGATVGSGGVETVSVDVTVVFLSRTLIMINTLDSVSHPAVPTATFEASRDVHAGGVHVTVVSSDLTLVNICAACRALLDEVSQLTVTDEGALGVLTVAMETDVRVQITLVHINASPHIHGGHESVVAETAVLARDVGTLAAITDIWTVLTLINISTGPEVRHQSVSLTTTAFIASLGVGAVCITASVHYSTLINIHTSLAVGRDLVARLTLALVGAHHVDAVAVLTQVVTQIALIHIFAGGTIGAELVSRGTLTLVTPLSVQTLASVAQQRITLTLINVHAVLHHHEAALVALEALTLEASWGVHTRTLTTDVRRDTTLIDVCAVPLLHGESEAAATATFEAANGVPAGSMRTQALEHLTLVHIFVEGSSRQDITAVGEAGSSGADGFVFGGVWFGTLLAVDTPGSPH